MHNSPDIGRFVQADPIGFGGGNNLYRHCGNNPLGFGDPLGLTDGTGGGGSESDQPQVPRKVEQGSPGPEGYVVGGRDPGDGVIVGGPETGSTGGGGTGYGTGGTGGYGSGGGGGYGSGGGGYGSGGGGTVTGGFIGGTFTGGGSNGGPSEGAGGGGGGRRGGGGTGSGTGGTGGSGTNGGGGSRWGNPIWDLPFWNDFFGPELWQFINTPATAEQIAWTQKGMWPTFIAAGIILAPVIAPESGLYAVYGVANSYLTNPIFWGEFAESALPGGMPSAITTYGPGLGVVFGKTVDWAWDKAKAGRH